MKVLPVQNRNTIDITDERWKTANKESLQRGTVFFPLQYYFCNTADPYYDLPLHWHVEFELIHIISGVYTMFITNHEVPLHEGEICFLPGGILHGDGQNKGKSLYESVVFDIDMLQLHSYSPDIFINDIVNHTVFINNVIKCDHEDICAVVYKFFTTVKLHAEGYELLSVGYLLLFLGLLKKNRLYTEKDALPVHKRMRTEQLKSVLNMIRKNYGQELTLRQMADTAGLSSKYFCRIFHEITGRSPIEYLNWFRINRACTELRETEEKLSEIAFKCGFNDFSYFIKMFRRYKGMTPFKYRSFDSLKENSTKV